MPNLDDVTALSALPLLEAVPRSELEWLSERGGVLRFATGAILKEPGESIDEMWIVLGGHVAVHVEKGGSWRKFYDVVPNYVLGVMPYSRMRISPARLVIEEEAIVFALHRSHFRDLVSQCPELSATFVHHLLDRSRDYRTAQLHDDRSESLGRLAAGLAHELNNPASAAASHARALTPLLDHTQAASKTLLTSHLTTEQFEAIDAVRRVCTEIAQPRTPLDASDREEELSEWLIDHGIDPQFASAFATTNVSVAALDHLAEVLPTETLGAAIQWAAGDTATRQVAAHIMAATGRIHDLVSAVKGFTFMDRGGAPENVDIARGLADTVAMLESKSHAKSVRVHIETPDELPTIYGVGGELNQVWAKLIDNAIDAAPVSGNVTVTATKADGSILVSVMDDGPGVPEEHRARIFDPFFTTKPVGAGTGLGLDIARRFVHLSDGDLDFSSQPGHTVFRVRLPLLTQPRA